MEQISYESCGEYISGNFTLPEGTVIEQKVTVNRCCVPCQVNWKKYPPYENDRCFICNKIGLFGFCVDYCQHSFIRKSCSECE